MRRLLPGGATLDGGDHAGDKPWAVCRPGAGVMMRTVPRRPAQPKTGAAPKTEADTTPEPAQPSPPPPPPPPPSDDPTKRSSVKVRRRKAGRLSTIKLLLQVLTALVGLIAAVLALFGLTRK
jgi:hypothetical protein